MDFTREMVELLDFFRSMNEIDRKIKCYYLKDNLKETYIDNNYCKFVRDNARVVFHDGFGNYCSTEEDESYKTYLANDDLSKIIKNIVRKYSDANELKNYSTKELKAEIKRRKKK